MIFGTILDRVPFQIRLRLKTEAQHLGFSTADLAGQIGDASGGLEVQRILRDGDEMKVSVSLKHRRHHSSAPALRYLQRFL
jgi:multidrug efflux pump subunit AcrB